MYAIIDIGSNTIRLNVYQVEEDGAIHSIFQSKETAGLAGYVREDGSMSREGLDRAADALLRFRSILDALHIENRAVFATASLRNITNSEEAVFQLQERTGLMIRLLSGREEAILDYVGATSGMEEQGAGHGAGHRRRLHRVGLLLSGQDTPRRLHPPGLPEPV